MERRNEGTGTPPDGRPPSDRVGLWAGALGLTLSAGAALLSVACVRHATTVLESTPGGSSSPALGLEVVTVGIASVIAGWLALLLLTGTLSMLPARHLTPLHTVTARIAPHLGPRIAAGLVGSVVALSSAGAAQAHSPEAVTTSASASTRLAQLTAQAEQPPDAQPAPEPGWRPTASPTAPAAAIELVSRGTAEPDTVVVRAGDTLWDLAARHLGPEADAAAIAEAWPRWHEANEDVIGADPHLLLPGTVLVPPAAEENVSEVAS